MDEKQQYSYTVVLPGQDHVVTYIRNHFDVIETIKMPCARNLLLIINYIFKAFPYQYEEMIREIGGPMEASAKAVLNQGGDE